MRFILLVLVFALNINASNKNMSYVFSTGLNFPVFGDFGDGDIGFKKSYGFNIGVFKNYDDLVSYGFIVSQSSYYKNRKIDIKFNIFSFTPSILGWIDNQRTKYFYFGPGLYHWKQPKTSTYSSTSGDEGGFRVGVGFKKEYRKIFYGGCLEFNHLFNINGKNFDLGPSNTLSLLISFYLNP
jgi:hypothetical protein